MLLVVVESPYAGDIRRNVAYAKAAVHDCILRSEAPIASHLLLPGIFNDAKPEERWVCMAAGHAWIEVAESVVVYTDLGISLGMEAGIACANEVGTPVKYRTLPGWLESWEVNNPEPEVLR